MRTGTTIGSLLLAISLWGMAPAHCLAQSDQEQISNPDLKCLKCHSKNLKKKLEDGETMSLHIEAADFETSVHRVIGCTGCHRDVAKSKHPSREPIASSRAYSLKHNQTCAHCHGDKSEDYLESIHASLVAEGSADAPLCSDCHSSHSIQFRASFNPENGEPCSKCHADINEAYEQSVHGRAHTSGNQIRGKFVKAPICSDCHQAHDIRPPSDDDYLVSQCTSCHEVAELAHKEWLPNPAMHMRSVGCAVCHAPDAELRVDLQLYDRNKKAPVRQSENNVDIQAMLAEIDTNGDGLDPIELWNLMLQSNKDEPSGNIILRGRLEVANDLDMHRVEASTEAVRTCENCHQANSEAFQNVTVSISRPDGRKETYKASSSVLNSPISVDSVGGFYAPGGTRIKILDVLLVLAIVAGLAVPIGHFALGKYLRRKK